VSLYTEILPDDSKECGIHEQQLETAVQVWTWMQASGDFPPTVSATAKAFNTTPEIIRKCVKTATWMFLTGPDDDPTKQVIGHDGE
jgi:hypothetical protein